MEEEYVVICVKERTRKMPRHLVIHTHTTNAWETPQGLGGSGQSQSVCSFANTCQYSQVGQELLMAKIRRCLRIILLFTACSFMTPPYFSPDWICCLG